ncbi:phenylacetate-CoA oxygenase subunit PaaI [Sphingobacteriaceae bacterium]|nr:phenylacetate-CoA oxygenase subunit PaaI [Sphingobacteriaceae bacterium]
MEKEKNNQHSLFNYVLSMADTSLILSHRLSEWCGHGPVIEQDIAMSNIALDLIGEARNFYDYAASLEGKGKSEDDYAYFRESKGFKNLLLCEQPNGDFAHTILRQFLFDSFHYHVLSELRKSPDETLRAIAEKSFKEVSYHIKWSSEWVIRLGDGTDVSKQKMETALKALWMFSGELTEPTADEKILIAQKIIPDFEAIKKTWLEQVTDVFTQASLTVPTTKNNVQQGGKTGKHSEHLSYLLAEMQSVQRAYPGLQW